MYDFAHMLRIAAAVSVTIAIQHKYTTGIGFLATGAVGRLPDATLYLQLHTQSEYEQI